MKTFWFFSKGSWKMLGLLFLVFKALELNTIFLSVCVFRLHFPLIKFCTFGTWYVWSFFWCRGIHDYPPLTIKSIPCECSSLGGWNVDCNVQRMLQQWYATKTEDRDSCRIYHVESVNKEQVVTFNYCESGQILQNHHWRISPICLSI